jgi:hypothetical protein
MAYSKEQMAEAEAIARQYVPGKRATKKDGKLKRLAMGVAGKHYMGLTKKGRKLKRRRKKDEEYMSNVPRAIMRRVKRGN